MTPARDAAAAPGAVPIGLVVGDWLSYSETFIHDQVAMQRRTRCHVCARQLVPGALDRFPCADLVSLGFAELKLYRWARRAPSFVRFLRAAGARLLHAHFGTNGVHALPTAEALGVPLVVTFHGHDVAGLDGRNRFVRRYAWYQLRKRELFERAALLVCASADLAERLERHGAPSGKIVVHRLGIDVRRFSPTPAVDGPLRVLMVGRLVEKKGMEFGLAAFARVHRRHREATLTIVGDGPRAERLRRLAMALGVGDAVRFAGVLAPADVERAMRSADVLMAPSVTAADGDVESGVLVLKEAAACGLPGVGTRHGGIPEIIEDGRTGCLVPERDVDALASALLDLADHPSRRASMGEAARAKIAREYDTRVQNERLESLLLDVAR